MRKGVVDTVGTTEMGRISTATGSGETMDMMHMVRGCTVDLHPVAAVVITDIILRTLDIFKVHPVILLKVSPDPGIASEVDIVAVGEGDAHHRPDNTPPPHRLVWIWLRGRSSST